MITKEIWKKIEGLDGDYEVSNMGRIKSLHFKGRNVARIINGITDKHGYKIIMPLVNGKPKRFAVHRLVARAFPEICGAWFEGCVINHKDENPANNKAENLEVCTQGYNNRYGNRGSKISKSRSHPIAQLTLECEFIRCFDSACAAAKELGIANQNIYKALHGEISSAYGFKWQYA